MVWANDRQWLPCVLGNPCRVCAGAVLWLADAAQKKTARVASGRVVLIAVAL